MDYELTIDLSDATSQAYTTTLASLIRQLIPSFDIRERNKFFRRVQIKCDINVPSLPDSKILPALTDKNNTKQIGGCLIKFENVTKPIINFVKQQKEKNLKHKAKLIKMNNNNNNSHLRKSKNRTFITKNKLFLNDEKVKENDNLNDKQQLISILPSPPKPNKFRKTDIQSPPTYANIGLLNNNDNDDDDDDDDDDKKDDGDDKNGNDDDKKMIAAITPPPPPYQAISDSDNDDDDGDGDDRNDNNDKDNHNTDNGIDKDEEIARKLQADENRFNKTRRHHKHSPYPTNDKNGDHWGIGLSDEQWQLQHALLGGDANNDNGNDNNNNNDLEEEKEIDTDYALALKLQEKYKQDRDDEKLALKLQKEEERKAKSSRANKYRNPNFVGWGNRHGDHDYVHASFNYTHSHNDNDDDDDDDDDDDVDDVDDGINDNPGLTAQQARIQQMHQEILSNDNMMLSQLIHQFNNNMGGMGGLHGVRIGGMNGMGGIRRRSGSLWRGLPTRILTEKDIELLSKSDDKKSCAICMNNFCKSDTTRQLPCFHEFHKDCVDKWFLQQNDKGNDASCPLDRKKIKDTARQQF